MLRRGRRHVGELRTVIESIQRVRKQFEKEFEAARKQFACVPKKSYLHHV